MNLGSQRFVNELLSYKEIGGACLRQRDGIAFQVFDEDTMAQAQEIPFNLNFRAALNLGIVRQADSISQIAGSVGLDGMALESTVARYNAMITGEVDTEAQALDQFGARIDGLYAAGEVTGGFTPTKIGETCGTGAGIAQMIRTAEMRLPISLWAAPVSLQAVN